MQELEGLARLQQRAGPVRPRALRPCPRAQQHDPGRVRGPDPDPQRPAARPDPEYRRRRPQGSGVADRSHAPLPGRGAERAARADPRQRHDRARPAGRGRHRGLLRGEHGVLHGARAAQRGARAAHRRGHGLGDRAERRGRLCRVRGADRRVRRAGAALRHPDQRPGRGADPGGRAEARGRRAIRHRRGRPGTTRGERPAHPQFRGRRPAPGRERGGLPPLGRLGQRADPDPLRLAPLQGQERGPRTAPELRGGEAGAARRDGARPGWPPGSSASPPCWRTSSAAAPRWRWVLPRSASSPSFSTVSPAPASTGAAPLCSSN